MAIYHVDDQKLVAMEETTFEAVGLKERSDLQRLLREQIDVIAPDTLVLSEEFSDWEESRRRIDLLGLDKQANLVVVELKRTEDGGHMELQAIRYAAMVSAITFDRAVDIHQLYRKRLNLDGDARTTMLEFLGWDNETDGEFAQDVQILLASAEFSKELTTAVLWLNDRGLEIRCVRLKPYKFDSKIFLDVQQAIPLPEAAEYQIQVRQKEQVKRRGRAERHKLRHRFWEQLLSKARERTKIHANISPGDWNWLSASTGVRGFTYQYTIRERDGGVLLYIDRGKGQKEINESLFDELARQKDDITRRFGDELVWDRLDQYQASIIKYTACNGGYRSPELEWSALHDQMIDAMIRFDTALRPAMEAIESSDD